MFNWIKKFFWNRVKSEAIESFDLSVDTLKKEKNHITILVRLEIFGEQVLNEKVTV